MNKTSTGAEDFIPYQGKVPTERELLSRSLYFYRQISSRRSLRAFSTRTFSEEVIRRCIQSAGCAPSGANKQPWSFCVVSDPVLKKKIREAAEKEEHINYHGRMSEQWLADLAPLGTHEKKPFLEQAPYLIVVFKHIYELKDNQKAQNYYVNESIGLACGVLLVAIHQAGLVALTHTPSPMDFLSHLLNRPRNERPVLLIPVGYPASDAVIPNICRKPLKDIAFFY